MIEIRRGKPDDSRPAFDVSMSAMRDLFARQEIEWTLDPESFWTLMEPIMTHLASHAAEWWVAEDPSDASLVGYARSIERGGLIELSEFFVRPDRQSAGLGGRLLERAFAPGRGEVRVIIATSDLRGLARYYRAGTVARLPMASLTGQAQPTVPGELEAVSATLDDVAEVASIEQAVMGYPRHKEYPWLFQHREAFLYRRGGRAVGFAFVGDAGQGPIAALDPADQAPILLHVEGHAHARGVQSVSFEVPMINEVVMRHLLGRGYRIEPPLNHLMSNVPFERFDRFIAFGPSIFL